MKNSTIYKNSTDLPFDNFNLLDALGPCDKEDKQLEFHSHVRIWLPTKIVNPILCIKLLFRILFLTQKFYFEILFDFSFDNLSTSLWKIYFPITLTLPPNCLPNILHWCSPAEFPKTPAWCSPTEPQIWRRARTLSSSILTLWSLTTQKFPLH